MCLALPGRIESTFTGDGDLLFGRVAFGSVFALETIIPALWVHPLEEPVLMLVVPMARAPAATRMRALAMSQAFGSTRIGPSVW